MMIRGIYKLPAIKHTFLIFESSDHEIKNAKELIENRRKKECFAHIFQTKDHMPPKEILLWRLKSVSEDDFLSVIRQYVPREIISSSQSSNNPEMLELLAINILKTTSYLSTETCETPKFLCNIPDEDIIEVFI